MGVVGGGGDGASKAIEFTIGGDAAAVITQPGGAKSVVRLFALAVRISRLAVAAEAASLMSTRRLTIVLPGRAVMLISIRSTPNLWAARCLSWCLTSSVNSSIVPERVKSKSSSAL